MSWSIFNNRNITSVGYIRIGAKKGSSMLSCKLIIGGGSVKRSSICLQGTECVSDCRRGVRHE